MSCGSSTEVLYEVHFNVIYSTFSISIQLHAVPSWLWFMDKSQFVLATMTLFPDREFSPVQVQKLFFLLDRHLPEITDCAKGVPYFDFVPKDYGPSDNTVYEVLAALNSRGLMQIAGNGWRTKRTYMISVAGFQEGTTHLSFMSPAVRNYIERLGNWVLSLSFRQLITEIYRSYPEMKVNGVFND